MAAVWVELVDEGTGRVYYYNNVSGATQWIMPPAFQVRLFWGSEWANSLLLFSFPFPPVPFYAFSSVSTQRMQ